MSEFFCELMTESLLREASPADVLESRCGGQSTQSLRFLQARKRHVPELLARACRRQFVQRPGQSLCKLSFLSTTLQRISRARPRPSMIFRRESRMPWLSSAAGLIAIREFWRFRSCCGALRAKIDATVSIHQVSLPIGICRR